jgi:hypothetical protein
VCPDVCDDAVSQGERIHRRAEQLRPEFADHGEVNAVLDLRERIRAARRVGDRASSGKTLV